MTAPITATDATLPALLAQHPNVVLDLWAPWCGPCKRLDPILDELSQEYGPRVAVAKLNTDEHPQTMTKYGVMGLPSILVFKNGKRVDHVTGLMAKPQLAARLNHALGL